MLLSVPVAGDQSFGSMSTPLESSTSQGRQKSHRRRRAGSAFAASNRQEIAETLTLCKPIEVLVRFNGEFGGKWDSFKETGNGTTRVKVLVASTDVEYPVDSVLDETRTERCPEMLVVEPIVDDLKAGKDYVVFAIGPRGGGKTHSLFSGDDADMGIAYTMCRSLLSKKRERASNMAASDSTEYITDLSFSMYELHNDERVVDLVDVGNTDARLDPLREYDARETVVESVKSTPVTSQAGGVSDLFDASQRRTSDEENACATNPCTVLQFTVRFERLEGSGKHIHHSTSNVYLIEVHAGERDKFRKMCDNVADGDLTYKAFPSPVTRLVLPKILDYGMKKHAFIVACLKGTLQDKPATLQTLKAVRSAYELRVNNRERQSPVNGSPFCYGTTATSEGGSGMGSCTPRSLDPSDTRSADGDLDLALDRDVMNEQDMRIRHVERKLEQKGKQIKRLQELLDTKEHVLNEERCYRVCAEEQEQDAKNAAKVLRDRAASVQQLKDDAVALSSVNNTLRQQLQDENAARASSVADIRRRVEAANDEKYEVLYRLDAMKKQLQAIAQTAPEKRTPEIIANLCALLDIAEEKKQSNAASDKFARSRTTPPLKPAAGPKVPSKSPASFARSLSQKSAKSASPSPTPRHGGFAPVIPARGGVRPASPRGGSKRTQPLRPSRRSVSTEGPQRSSF